MVEGRCSLHTGTSTDGSGGVLEDLAVSRLAGAAQDRRAAGRGVADSARQLRGPADPLGPCPLRENVADLLAARADQLRRQIETFQVDFQLSVTKLSRIPAVVVACATPGARLTSAAETLVRGRRFGAATARLVADVTRTAALTAASETEARARAALEVSTARLEILSRTAHELAAVSGDQAVVLELAVRRIGELIGEACAIRLVSEDGAWIEPTATFYVEDRARRALVAKVLGTARAPVGEGIGGRVAATGEAILMAELTTERTLELAKAAPAFLALIEQLGVSSLLTLPLRSRDRTIGVVSLLRSTPGNPYTIDDQRFAQEIADRAGLAIDNAVLVANLERRVAARTAALELANHELEAFSYSVSHDLRAPLRAIDGYSQLVLSDHADQLDDEAKGHLQRVRAAPQRMAGLIDDLLNLARITRSHLRWAAVDLSSIAAQVVAELRSHDPDRTTVVHLERGVTAHGDARLLTIVLENVLGNAWKFTKKHPAAEIWFGQAQRDGRTVLVVRDTGAGFDMKHAEKLFVPFQRLHAASDYEGVGIGLATVQRIVARHNGQIWAESEIDGGAVFFIALGDRP